MHVDMIEFVEPVQTAPKTANKSKRKSSKDLEKEPTSQIIHPSEDRKKVLSPKYDEKRKIIPKKKDANIIELESNIQTIRENILVIINTQSNSVGA